MKGCKQMKMQANKRILAMILALVMIITCLWSPAMATETGATSSDAAATLTQTVEDGNTPVVSTTEESDPNEVVTIMVKLDGDTTFMQTNSLEAAVASSDTMVTALTQAANRVATTLNEKIVVDNTYSLLFNGFSFTGEAWMIDAINEMDGVSAFRDFEFELVEATSTNEMTTTPSMSKSTNLTSADLAWDLGYTGAGMVVAVIDTGIYKEHEAFSQAPANPRIDMAYLTRVYDAYGAKMHAGTEDQLADMYYSSKMPFNWDYVENDADAFHIANDHGTHVAGIAAGNNG